MLASNAIASQQRELEKMVGKNIKVQEMKRKSYFYLNTFFRSQNVLSLSRLKPLKGFSKGTLRHLSNPLERYQDKLT